MRAVVQRVRRANVNVDGLSVAAKSQTRAS